MNLQVDQTISFDTTSYVLDGAERYFTFADDPVEVDELCRWKVKSNFTLHFHLVLMVTFCHVTCGGGQRAAVTLNTRLHKKTYYVSNSKSLFCDEIVQFSGFGDIAFPPILLHLHFYFRERLVTTDNISLFITSLCTINPTFACVPAGLDSLFDSGFHFHLEEQ